MVSQPDLFGQMGASPDGSVDHFEDQVRSLQISIQVRFCFSPSSRQDSLGLRSAGNLAPRVPDLRGRTRHTRL